jgi:tetratricopeptide (TPR) repeat protein
MTPPTIRLRCGSPQELLRFVDDQVRARQAILAGRPPVEVGEKLLLGLELADDRVFWLRAQVTAIAPEPARFQITFGTLDAAQEAYLRQLSDFVAAQRKPRTSGGLHADYGILIAQAERAFARGDFDESIRVYDTLSRTTAPTLKILAGLEEALGQKALKNGVPEAAIALFRKALEVDPKRSRLIPKLRDLQRARAKD